MNERIRLLKHQASIWCDENIPNQFSEETNGYGRAWEDKFAELIIRECAGIADGLLEDNTGAEVMARIKEHFGVE